MHEGEEGHARPGWTTSRRGQDSPWKSQSEWQRTGINGENTSMVWTTLGSRTAKEQEQELGVNAKICFGDSVSIRQLSQLFCWGTRLWPTPQGQLCVSICIHVHRRWGFCVLACLVDLLAFICKIVCEFSKLDVHLRFLHTVCALRCAAALCSARHPVWTSL